MKNIQLTNLLLFQINFKPWWTKYKVEEDFSFESLNLSIVKTNN